VRAGYKAALGPIIRSDLIPARVLRPLPGGGTPNCRCARQPTGL